jgi:hypothetical protein
MQVKSLSSLSRLLYLRISDELAEKLGSLGEITVFKSLRSLDL